MAELLSPLRCDNSEHRRKKAENVVNVGLFCNTVLALVKVVAGIIGHSQALLADGINSISDVIYFIAVKIFVRLSGKPADCEHPYGHHQLESIAALVIGAFVITTGAAIFWDSIDFAFKLFTGAVPSHPIGQFALYVALATIFTKILLMLQARKVGQETGNLAIKALAQDHLNDIFASAGAAIGITLSQMGAPWVDPVAGAVVAVIMAKTGLDILREASSDLMDNVPSEELAREIYDLLEEVIEVEAIEDIHAHRFGPYLVVNLTICIDGDLTVRKGDEIADQVESKLLKGIEMLRKVYVHYHPAGNGTKMGDAER
ncbi:MAG: cation diffusion facilitator family transporter [Candidatus Electrothrix aestuarii]|uniref:Cation diffusion facilitator family transporter n=1 Tax=Candidatus Electrothrix aestuarii TaxID=3062594 RepID=A0AAU8LW17_9BACT|nr:cation diffusion facilitator family transporter [Candidatus Electrothrix aestuarii]